MTKRMSKKPKIRAHRPYVWLTKEQREDLMTWAREIGDVETASAELRRRFKDKYDQEISRHVAIHWRNAAFDRKAHARGIPLDRDTATRAESLIKAGHFDSIGQVVSVGVGELYKERMEADAKEGTQEVPMT